jgi:methionyl-tRNA formyltransferase
MSQTPIIFFGTHDFAVAMLDSLLTSGEFAVQAVVTQPDRPVGRDHALEQSPVKQFALSKGLTVLEPETLKTFAIDHADFKTTTLFVVCQYGLIIPQSVLDLPKQGTINVHTSLLPKYRGASPIQSALIHGETTTGITIMLMDKLMDHGPILRQVPVKINADDTYPTLSAGMAQVAGPLLVMAVNDWLAGRITPEVQDESAVTTCTMLTRDDGKIDFSKSATHIYNQFRGTYPWPGLWTTWDDKRLKLLAIKPTTESVAPGTVSVASGRILIGTVSGAIEVLELQLEGKKPMTASVFIQGHQTFSAAKLG